MNLNDDLLNSLNTGFINQDNPSNSKYLPQLIINDYSKGKKVHDSIRKELLSCQEFWFSVAFVTTGGLATLYQTLLELEAKGVQGKILVSSYLNFTQPEALKKLLRFSNISLKLSTENNFHSKGYLFINGEWYDLIIGSSNLTATALSSNTEWNLKISATPKSEIISKSIFEFQSEYDKATIVTNDVIQKYSEFYQKQLNHNKLFVKEIQNGLTKKIVPNSMQVNALKNIHDLRKNKKDKALLISATGTGKTFLSAFDVQNFNPNKFLFIVHRLNIADAALKTFKTIFGNSRTMGIYSGDKKEIEADFIFCTVQTLSKKENYEVFSKNHFDYIVFDESHRVGAESYQRLFDYLKPKFLLGMTATPERTDGFDIFKLFDYNIAYEIRLHKALEEDMLCPFHYYGVRDIWVDGKEIDENANFNQLTSKERVNHLIEKIGVYGSDSGVNRGLIFCSTVAECEKLAFEFNNSGIKSIALSGLSGEDDRKNAISNLESDIESEKIDYIFTRDIFNEGVDIPKVNQIILLRPTQSPIIFVQQLGRGLRKAEDKSYLTVIDFIGNYKNNFLIPVALYGDTSYSKDRLRKLISSGSNEIPGSSTINFEKIIEKRIFEAIDSAKMQLRKDLVSDYELLKFKIGRIPMMIDFLQHGSRDPFLYININLKLKSYFDFVESIEKSLNGKLTPEHIKLLGFFATEINNSKRVFESILIKELIANTEITVDDFNLLILNKFDISINFETITSIVSNLNFDFVTEKQNGKLVTLKEKYNFKVTKLQDGKIKLHSEFIKLVSNKIFYDFLIDNINCSLLIYDSKFKKTRYNNGFLYYEKYSRKDVFRILNWTKNPVPISVGGYMISPDKSNCALFVNYKKSEDISKSTKYEDKFIMNSEFQWMTKNKRNFNSPEVKIFKTQKIRIPLFINKSKDEGEDFYYMGELEPIMASFEETKILNDNGKYESIVKINFKLDLPVEDNLYNYITNI